MIAGYHTAGLLEHDTCIAIRELAHLGYQCIAIRPHAAHLNPQLPGFGQQVLRLADAIAKVGLRSVLDLDAPFIQDPFSRRGPSLVAAEDDQRQLARDWIETWFGVADEIGSDLITFASGAVDRGDCPKDEEILERLSAQLNQLLRQAAPHKVSLALRPRSDDAIATVAQFERLGHWLGDESPLLLAADIGEMLIGGELPVVDRLARNRDALACVYMCDRRAGVEGDQRIGHGDVALKRILGSLKKQAFQGAAIVRVERHSELGFTPAAEAIQIFEET